MCEYLAALSVVSGGLGYSCLCNIAHNVFRGVSGASPPPPRIRSSERLSIVLLVKTEVEIQW